MVISPRINNLLKRDNVNCPYCGADLQTVCSNEEHVIGRKFPPSGQMAAQWNVVLNACVSCNTKKSALEGEISAITLQSLHFPSNPPDELVLKEAARKGTARSSQTGKTVRDSFVNHTIERTLMGALEMSINFVGPPQLDNQQAFELAFLQVSGFFFFLTFDQSTRLGVCCTGIPEKSRVFSGFQHVRKEDWGNPRALEFSKLVCGWDKRFDGVTAKGFYKIAIRRKPNADCWSWAVEWNKTTRIFGGFGDKNEVEALNHALPAQLRQRLEVPLEPHEDLMFAER